MFNFKKLLKQTTGVLPLAAAGAAVVVFYSTWFTGYPSAAEQPKVLPAPLSDIVEKSSTQTAVFAGGCFWGTQGVFQHVDGVISAKAGYAGGSAQTAVYELTETGTTGHAEAINIVYDPNKVTYGKLLQIFFSVAHDPTQLDQQGADIGNQYRSAIFPQNEEQAAVATSYIDQLNKAHSFASKIVTTMEPGKTFYQAEDYHQNYLVNNPTQPYIAFVEQPKINALRDLFPAVWRDEPQL
ncbi:peptide-methionine (S)-S-oxide reductase MsrA [Rhizobium sp. S163]|uniref:peptide-methionine (S)-S-oxide reductase MsrA n=1 Tax=Rhizobium sp. S163 TaxID=3055039 RepID=UPI0025A9D6CA|nr:peptide-methionine (S)-S-oxide reductase MsrA [Rhizobium sp. S163]MDM9648682.1 peptide-methionine (S)-S-oxide reductase MsrA [Rhizobium sp. S163]